MLETLIAIAKKLLQKIKNNNASPITLFKNKFVK
jgi:hypothetical protein